SSLRAARDALREVRRRQYRVSGRRRCCARPRLCTGVGFPPRRLLGGAFPRALPRAPCLLSRLILFDKRETGLSDRVGIDELPTLEQRMDDVRAVMDAVGSERAAL